MAHSMEEPAGDDLIAAFDIMDISTVYTSEGPITHLVSLSTGHRIRVPTESLPHLAALILAEWQDHEPDDDEDEDED